VTKRAMVRVARDMPMATKRGDGNRQQIQEQLLWLRGFWTRNGGNNGNGDCDSMKIAAACDRCGARLRGSKTLKK
jgi:hypothetical protein